MLAQLNDCIGGLLHLGPNVITFRALLHLGPNVITFRTLRTVITFRTSTEKGFLSETRLERKKLSDQRKQAVKGVK